MFPNHALERRNCFGGRVGVGLNGIVSLGGNAVEDCKGVHEASVNCGHDCTSEN